MAGSCNAASGSLVELSESPWPGMDEYEKHLTLLWVASRASWGNVLDVDG